MGVDNSKIVYGGDMMIFLTSGATKTPVAFSTSAKLSLSVKTRDISSKDSGVWTDKLSGKLDWNVSTDGLLNFTPSGGTWGVESLFAQMVGRAAVTVTFASTSGTAAGWTLDASKKNFTGQAIITSLEINASDGDNGSYSISLEGAGSLVIA